jgi:hypothetical protein
MMRISAFVGGSEMPQPRNKPQGVAMARGRVRSSNSSVRAVQRRSHQEQAMRIFCRFSANVAALAALAVMSHGPATAAPAASTKPTTHLLAMAACPDWKVIPDDPKTTKLMAESCEKDIDTMVPALSKSMGIDKANVTTRLNAEADHRGVTAAIIEPDDRVVIYLNFHGGDLGGVDYDGYDIQDEVLALYTSTEPDDFGRATADGSWMTIKHLRNLINEVQAKEVIVIFEVCESSAGLHDFRYDLSRRYKNNWKGRQAVIFSSRGDQAATFNEEGTLALFTDVFSKNLNATTSGNIRDIFEQSAMETHRSRRETCMKEDNLDTLYLDRATYLDGCTQMPMSYDPYGLLDDIMIGGVTANSRWHEVEAQNRKPPAKKKKDDADPFAWTKPLMEQSKAASPNAPAAANSGPVASN